MAVNLSPVGGVAAQFFDNSGNVLTGGKLYTYAAGTTTPAVTYTTSLGGTPHSNPIVLDAAGRVPNSGEIWLTDGISYKFILKDSNDVQIATWDNIIGINSNIINYSLQTETATATQSQTIFTLATIQYQPATNSLSVFVNGSRQIITDNYIETSSTVVTFVDGLNVGDVVEFITATSATGNATTAANVSYNEGQSGAITYTVQAKLQQSVSIKDFGAIGDGVTDDTAAIQAALNASEYVYVPDGVYKITTIQLKHIRSFLFGSGQLSQIYTTPDETYAAFPLAMITVSSTVKEVHLDGLYIEAIGYGTAWTVSMTKSYPGGNYYPAPCYGLATFDFGGAFNNVTLTSITNCKFEELYGGGIKASGVVNIVGNTILNCTGYKPIHDVGQGYDADGDGIYVTQNYASPALNGGLISANNIYTTVNGRAGIVCEFDCGNVAIIGNTIGTYYERGVHLESNNNADFSVIGNNITAQNCILVSGSSVKASNNTLNVFDNGATLYVNLAGAFSFIGGCNGSRVYKNTLLGTSTVRNYQVIYSESGLIDLVVDSNVIGGRINLIGSVNAYFYNNDIFYQGTSTIAQTAYIGGGDAVEFVGNRFLNISIYSTTTPTKLVFKNNDFQYNTGITTYAPPLVFDGVGEAQLIIENNLFNLTQSTATAAIYWAGSLSTGIIGTLSNNQIWTTTGTPEIIEPGRVSYNQPFHVSIANIKFDPSSNAKVTSQLLTTDLSGWQGQIAYGSAAPTTGTWAHNDIVYNINTASAGYIGWVCTVAGTPGTWKTFGLIS